MATKVNKNSESIKLQDGSSVEVGPLNIKNLRKFMEATKKFGEAKDDLEGLDVMIDAVEIALAASDSERFSEIDREALEELLDIASITQIMKVAGGVDLDNPNPPAARG